MKEQLGHYEIVEELGRGGMGVVYKGYESALGRFVAIKELSPSLAHDPMLVERFLREARSMASLNDPHIIQVYFIGTDEDSGQPFFAMEYVEGDSLSGLLKREGKLSLENALKVMHQTALGLATAHDKGVVHRDIKPGNLMLTPRGNVKIADFGIALATQDFARSSPRPASLSARRAISRRKSASARRSTSARIFSRSASCCSKCSPATFRLPKKVRWV